ncbi:MAG: hypothetical protein HUU14_06890 [Dehalococcoidia bacterium]|nr:hypothetical protein [Dehalococcoidia bacterium]NUQ55594.1 hypothetical protein [Dehalococcoidia bacterium]
MIGRTVLTGMFLPAAILFASLLVGGGVPGHLGRADSPLAVEVTAADDATDAVCPHATKCSLRKAIELVNADPGTDEYLITFAEAAFPADTPATIGVADDPLPAITRAHVTVDARERGVRLDGSNLPEAGPPDGLVFEGEGAVVTGLSIHNFEGRCLVLAGASSLAGGNLPGDGNSVGGCAAGIVLAGASSRAEGNRAGFVAGGTDEAALDIGILVTAASATVGGPTAGHGNLVGHAETAIRVGAGAGAPFENAKVAHNVVGGSPGGGEAPVGVGVDLRQPGSRTSVEDNLITHAETGIRVAATEGGTSVTGNTFANNQFSGLLGMAIDLNADGQQNANDEGDADTGANNLLNHPVITRATQGQISGSAGATCAGCTVALYAANHAPGGAGDYGATAVAGGTAITGSTGAFQFDGLPLSPGQWVIALVTDGDGNTSEFGPSARVGAGVVQCANPALHPGWNQAGYFGSGTLTLGDAYPANGGQVASIHHLTDGTASFTSWYASTTAGRTLYTLSPGEAYWFFASAAVGGSGGFTLTVPVPVPLKAGWNEFVYIGATADVRDALASVAGRYTAVYRFSNDGTAARWQAWGDATTPDYVRAFTEMEACGVYSVHLTEDATLTPPHP